MKRLGCLFSLEDGCVPSLFAVLDLLPSPRMGLKRASRRCKLGPFRLGRALELFNEPSREAKNEFENLRSRAKRRLEALGWKLPRSLRTSGFSMF